jgi:hypothetical protein
MPFPMLDEPATRLVTALRLVCGGSVVATRSLAAQADDEFPFVPSGTASLRAFSGADNDRPTVVQPENIEAVRTAYQTLDLPQVRADKSLQVAIRRLIFAGSRSLVSDQIIDLMTCAEALFLKRSGKKTNAKGEPVATQAAALLGADPELSTDADRLHAFMMMVYQARTAEIHGDGEPYAPLHRLTGEQTTSLAQVVADAEHIMRRAIRKFLDELTAPPTT